MARWLMMVVVMGTLVTSLFAEEADRPRGVAKHGVVLIAGDAGNQPVRPTTWVIDRPRRRSIYTQPPKSLGWPEGGWRPDDERRVVSRMRMGPDFQTVAAMAAMADTLNTLLEANAITREIYERYIDDVKKRHRAAAERERAVEARSAEGAYRRGRVDVLRSLLKSGAISEEVYAREMVKARAADRDVLLDEYRGRMQVLTRLYHRGEIDTAAFLKYHTPVWDAWYGALNILPNGGFEQVEDRRVSDRLVDLADWHEVVYGYGDLGYSQIVLDRNVKRSGEQSLRFTCTRGPALISLLSSRFLCERDDAVKIRVFAKASGFTRGYTGRAATINFVMPEGSHDLSPAARLHLPAGTYDWTRFELRLHTFGHIPEGKSLPCQVSIKMYGEGTLWLDDLVVVPTTRRKTKAIPR